MVQLIEDSKGTSNEVIPRRPPAVQTKVSNPYNYISSYSHEARTIPPYVIAGIINNKNPSTNNENVQDPFISSMNNNWNRFFEAVDNTPAYTEGVLDHDEHALEKLPDLHGEWGGDERLKRYLNSEKDYENQTFLPKKWYQFSSSSSESNSETNIGTKSRSKAGYWMSTEKRDEWGPYLTRMFLYNNYVPLFFRIFIVITSIVALAISANIYRISQKQVVVAGSSLGTITQQPSTIMAICVQSIGMVYLLYITYDEFKSKPLGIRNPVEKLRLILLDLLFIIFSSANLSLSFNTLYDSRWVCTIDEYSKYPKIENICDNQRSLSAFLFIILTLWVATFTISIMRVIQKVSSPGGLS